MRHLGWLGTAHEMVHHVDSALHVGKLNKGLISISAYIKLRFYKRPEIPGQVFEFFLRRLIRQVSDVQHFRGRLPRCNFFTHSYFVII